MESVNDRFKILRKKCGKTQSEMGKVLGLSVSGVSEIEKGRRNVTEQHLIMLSNWKERLVNIEWLRTGEGEMFLQIPEEDETAALVYDLLGPDKESFYNIVLETIKAYKKLSPNSQKVINELMDNVIAGIKEKSKD